MNFWTACAKIVAVFALLLCLHWWEQAHARDAAAAAATALVGLLLAEASDWVVVRDARKKRDDLKPLDALQKENNQLKAALDARAKQAETMALDPIQNQILSFICQRNEEGCTNVDVAAQFQLSPGTADFHLDALQGNDFASKRMGQAGRGFAWIWHIQPMGRKYLHANNLPM